MTVPLKNYSRLFVAIPIPSSQTEILKSIQQQNNSLNTIRWTRPANLHVTIFFLGEVLGENVSRVKTALSLVIENTLPFQIEFEKISLAGKKNSGMIWAEFKKSNFFSALSNRIHEAVQDYLMIQPVFKEPVPHITLARLKNEPGTINLDFKIKFSIPEIKSCELWKTIQTKQGVVYESLEQFEFKK